MKDASTVEMQPTLGLTGLTSNAMALIAPGAFLWLTFYIQATTGTTAPAMWFGILIALLLCLATALSYGELAKLYPGPGSSYFFAEQAFLNRDEAAKYARPAKFMIGWASHLYYWIYPGVMVATMGILCGYLVGTLWPNVMSASNPGIPFMMLIAIVFAGVVGYIASRGVNGSTAVSVAINVIQISALLVFTFMAIHYRMAHPPGSQAWQFDAASGDAYTYQFATDAKGNVLRFANGTPRPLLNAAGQAVPYVVSYPKSDASGNFLTHPNARSVVAPHQLSWAFIQATVAILILVGFESCTALGGEAKNPKKDLPKAIILSLIIQGAIFYLIEYFAANYMLSSGYTMANATGSAAPIGDLMVTVGDAIFGAGHGRAFMLIEAVTVFLALIGTTLSCINTGARVTYAMGKDKEVPEHFGLLHSEKLTPHRAIWTLTAISAIVGCLALAAVFGDGGAPTNAAIAALPHGFWSSFGYTTHAGMAKWPNTLLMMTLASNFGTFLLYGMSNLVCIVAFWKKPGFKLVKHGLVPSFGIAANLACMLFYLIGPFMGYGTAKEPLLALGVAAAWGIYGAIYFARNKKAVPVIKPNAVTA